MVHSYRRKDYSRALILVVAALLLAIALPSAALAQDPPEPPGTELPPPPPPPEPEPEPEVPPVPPGTELPPPVPDPNDPNMPPELPDPGTGNGMMTTSSALSPNSIVNHAATPGQLIRSGAGLQYYFIGTDGSASSGPTIPSFSVLAETYSENTALFSGSNPYTFKSVEIDYLAAENKIRVSTYYPDNEYDTNKPYVYTVDAEHNVSHLQW